MVEKVKTLNRLPVAAEVSVVDRRQPIFKILVNGIDFVESGLHFCVQEIDLEMIDEGLSKVTVFLVNDGTNFTDDLFFVEGARIQIFMGYQAAGFVFMGQFILDTPRFEHTSTRAPRILLQGFSEEILLANEEKRRTFKNITDSRVAEIIAAENNLRPDIDQTSIIYPQISQVNESDMKFLQERAKLNGFQVYIEDSVLHYHKVRNDVEDVLLNYNDSDKGHLFMFNATIKRFKKAFTAEYSSIDPLSGKYIDLEAKEVKDAFSLKDENNVKDPRLAEDITGSPKKFIMGEGHIINPSELSLIAAAQVESSRWVVTAQAGSWGNPRVKPRRIITIEGVKKFSGQYYVKKVRHKIGKGYNMIIELRRTLTGKLRNATPIIREKTSSSGTRAPQRGNDLDFGKPNPQIGVVNTRPGSVDVGNA